MGTRVCVVTGSNKGIGFSIVKELCQNFTGIVYLTSRDTERGNIAVRQLTKDGLCPHYHQLDISSQDSITTFASYIRDTYGGFDVLINNAGTAFKSSSTEPFHIQAEETVRTNYFGTLNLCKALFPLLRSHARVVNVTSALGCLSYMKGSGPAVAALKARFTSSMNTIDDVNKLMEEFISHAKAGDATEAGWPSNTYSVSKMGLNALTVVQQRIFENDSREDMVVNSCHPGYVNTDMSSHQGTMTPDEGAVSPCYLAVLPPNISEPKGLFHWFDKRVVNWEAPDDK